MTWQSAGRPIIHVLGHQKVSAMVIASDLERSRNRICWWVRSKLEIAGRGQVALVHKRLLLLYDAAADAAVAEVSE